MSVIIECFPKSFNINKIPLLYITRLIGHFIPKKGTTIQINQILFNYFKYL